MTKINPIAGGAAVAPISPPSGTRALPAPAAEPPGPPEELYRAMADASSTFDELAAQGRRVHFDLAPGGGVAISMQDTAAGTQTPVAPAQLLTLIAGWATMA